MTTQMAKTEGELTISGQTKTIAMDVELTTLPDAIKFKGSYTLNMSDFGIKPPKLMMGAIKVKDPITVRFDLALNPMLINKSDNKEKK
jgi:polyisoprenoid-binding protein YceI